MSLAIFTNVVALGRMGAVAWAVIIALWALLVIWIYPSIGETDLEGYVRSMPDQLRAVAGLTDADLPIIFDAGAFTLVGYVNTEYLAWLPLLLGIYAVVYCGGLVSKEAERGTLDTMLLQPLHRTSFLLSKFAGFAALTLGVSVVSAASIYLGSLFIEGDVSPVNNAAVHAVSFMLAMAVAGYSTLASCLTLNPGKSLAAAGIITALSYFANILGTGVAGLSWVKYASLFHYYDSLQVIANGNVNWTGILVYAAVLATTIAASVAVFRRKDLTS